MDVPKATTVKPIAKLDIPYFFAAEDAPLTRKSAPFIRMANPTKRRTMGRTMELLGFGYPKDIIFLNFERFSLKN